MKTSQLRNVIALTSIGLLTVSVITAHASLTNIANGKPIIGGSGSWNANDYDASANAGHGPGEFNAQKVTDNGGASDPLGNAGTINEGPPGTFATVNYWLGREGGGPEYFVIDLGSYAGNIVSFDLFNTGNFDHSGGDRSTGDFAIYGANSVALINAAVDYDVIAPTLLASGTLAFQFSALTAQTFLASPVGHYRYIRFDALNAIAGHNASVGLNEIRIFAEVPEPSTLMLLGMGISALAFWRRSRNV